MSAPPFSTSAPPCCCRLPVSLEVCSSCGCSYPRRTHPRRVRKGPALHRRVRRRHMRIYMAMLVLVGGAIAAAQQTPQLPAPFATPSSTNRPVVVDAPAGARLQVPAGFSVETWADGFDTPRFMLQGSGGE